MAGSMHHIFEGERYVGSDLGTETLGDARETIEELAFVLLATTVADQRADALARFYRCARGEERWPDWWTPNKGWDDE
jgi:hypothetical protein